MWSPAKVIQRWQLSSWYYMRVKDETGNGGGHQSERGHRMALVADSRQPELLVHATVLLTTADVAAQRTNPTPFRQTTSHDALVQLAAPASSLATHDCRQSVEERARRQVHATSPSTTLAPAHSVERPLLHVLAEVVHCNYKCNTMP